MPARTTELGTVRRRRIRVSGTVQGVGFRPFVQRAAERLGLAGTVTNIGGAVVIDVQGPGTALAALLDALDVPPPLARVTEVSVVEAPVVPGRLGFTIRASVAEAPRGLAHLAADVATCGACFAELSDPTDRRYRHPFITCTDCGPRFTVQTAVPYDRGATTMAGFAMCATCAREYADPHDRRRHAETIACPGCGPTLQLWVAAAAEPESTASGAAAVDAAAMLLGQGAVVAVKGLGGFHLAVDASNDEAVARLRSRKRRDEKPFAVMVADEALARALVELDPASEALLASPRRPVVLAPRHPEPSIDVACNVAPGLADLGVVLPYTPVHHLLMRAIGGPLVMTSANVTDEPLAYRDAEGAALLGTLADALLSHDRPIHVRCDDSVVRSGASGDAPAVLRRARGYAPELLRLPVASPVPLLAVGGQLKSTVALVHGDRMVLSPHLGDLDHPAARTAFREAIGHLCDLYGVEPEVVAHDLHPGYTSTIHALDMGLPTVAVQHHHAHLAACLTDHANAGDAHANAGDALAGDVVALAFDGLGYGPGGELWGGELLVGGVAHSSRRGHLLEVPLPGGEAAIREPRRMALAWLAQLDATPAVARAVERLADGWPAAADVLALARSPLSAPTTSVGRLFDAVAALLGGPAVASYEGQAAMALEALADRAGESGRSRLDPMEIAGTGSLAVLDPRPSLQSLVGSSPLGAGGDEKVRAALAAGFHDALADGAARLVERAAASATVVLTGGVFQNRRLRAATRRALEARGFTVWGHRLLPASDGALSAGQAAAAAARLAG